jgi:hypothetical protein
MSISLEILHSQTVEIGEQVDAPSSSQDWDGTPLKEGDLVEVIGFKGYEWFVLVPKRVFVERNKYNPEYAGGVWKLGHRD